MCSVRSFFIFKSQPFFQIYTYKIKSGILEGFLCRMKGKIRKDRIIEIQGIRDSVMPGLELQPGISDL